MNMTSSECLTITEKLDFLRITLQVLSPERFWGAQPDFEVEPAKNDHRWSSSMNIFGT